MSEETPVAIFWDIDKLPLPSDSPTYETVHKITEKAHAYGPITLFRAYSDVPESVNGGSARFDLPAAGVSFVGYAQDGAKSIAMSIDMLVYAMDHPTPMTLVVVSDDNLLIHACSTLRMRKYRIVVVSPSDACHRMQGGVSAFIDWTRLMEAGDDGEELAMDSHSVQSLARASPTATPTLTPLFGSPAEAASPPLPLKPDVRLSLRASPQHSDVSPPSPSMFGPEILMGNNVNYPNNHCSQYPTCHCAHCAHWHEAEDIMTNRAQVAEPLPSSTEPAVQHTRSLSLSHRNPLSENATFKEPLTPKAEVADSVTGGHIATVSLPDSDSTPSRKAFGPRPVAALPLPTQHKLPVQTRGIAVEETYPVIDIPNTVFITADPSSSDNACQAGVPANRADASLNPRDGNNVHARPSQPPAVFQPLVDELRRQGGNQCQRSILAEGLMTRDLTAYQRAGVSNFKDYMDRAVYAGIVTAGTDYTVRPGVPWIALNPALRLSQESNQATPPSTSISRPPSSLEATSAAPQGRSLFQGLIDELREHGSHPDRSQVADSLLRKDSSAYTRAGVTSFKQFSAKAVAAGVVTLGKSKNDTGNLIPTIYLTPAWKHHRPATTQPKGSLAPLTERLREMRDNNITRPYRWTVHTALITENPSVYSDVGVGDFSEYAQNAERAGVVLLGGEGQRQWIALAVD
ncbi:hypothetical protein FIBSPDRAFT_1045952 [Athelia psychrophila]|uniref:NYN domain-containing protein n=1 Tax=Athelia psychrophila TaxID=1759441 RepID=A0A166HGI1_9AGAM|nr:hypothetical protein FIBSPDRAFT_1045952 [Fibularhizoctonia sp. CBS 109695]